FILSRTEAIPIFHPESLSAMKGFFCTLISSEYRNKVGKFMLSRAEARPIFHPDLFQNEYSSSNAS
ncbi:MAG: hypothetical protein WA951_08850, partial [Leeuwenhoekiella sp.]